MTTTPNVTRQMEHRSVIVAIAGAIFGTIALASLTDASMRPTPARVLPAAPSLVASYEATGGRVCTDSLSHPESVASEFWPSSARTPQVAVCDVASQ
jgi:hypothetical protein